MSEEARVSAEESTRWIAAISEGVVILVGHDLKRVAVVHENESGPRTFTLEPYEPA